MEFIPKGRADLYKKAIDKWGKELQVMMFFEETAELQKELVKVFRNQKEDYSKVSEEIADVEIMLEQLKVMFSCQALSNRFKLEKLKRLKKMLGGKK